MAQRDDELVGPEAAVMGIRCLDMRSDARVELVAVDAAQIVVGNDNNLPFSSRRYPQKTDDNEFVPRPGNCVLERTR